MNVHIIRWSGPYEAADTVIYHDSGEYTPEEMPDEIVDFLVGLLERWEARRVGL